MTAVVEYIVVVAAAVVRAVVAAAVTVMRKVVVGTMLVCFVICLTYFNSVFIYSFIYLQAKSISLHIKHVNVY